jgi:hypothetical protein
MRKKKSMKYSFRKGDFSPSGTQVGFHSGRVNQTYKVRFDSSCLYDDTLDWERDWNKLIGWSIDATPVRRQPHFSAKADFKLFGKEYVNGHHHNSVRFVWRSNKVKGVIEIAFYYYQDGIRHIQEFAELLPDVEYILGIFLRGSDVTLTCVEKGDSDSALFKTATVVLAHPFKAISSYKLFPYFGGNNPAWQDMTLEVTEL